MESEEFDSLKNKRVYHRFTSPSATTKLAFQDLDLTTETHILIADFQNLYSNVTHSNFN